MKNYELVYVVNPLLSAKETKEQKSKVDALLAQFDCTINEKDEIGLVPLAYPLMWNSQADVSSYYCTINPAVLDELKEELGLEKGLAKFFIYSMKDDESFLTFSELRKDFEEMEKAQQPDEELDEEDEDDADDDADQDS